MKVQINGIDHWIFFKYSTNSNGARQVDCYIEQENYKEIARGSSLCNPKDKFNKDVGRRVAFIRAIFDYNKENADPIFNREERKLLGQTYFGRKPKLSKFERAKLTIENKIKQNLLNISNTLNVNNEQSK